VTLHWWAENQVSGRIEDAQRSGDIVVFAGHHNWNRLGFASQARIAELFDGIDHPLVRAPVPELFGEWPSQTLRGHSR
jgi:hypothetical protein